MLVVVLIIGILAAVALPKYEQAVEKSRAIEGISLARSIALANDAYYLANGTYTNNIEDLDLDFPGENVNRSGILTKVNQYFECRAQSSAGAQNSRKSVCRRNDLPYFIYYANTDTHARCGFDNEEGERWCKYLTAKTTSPYIFE